MKTFDWIIKGGRVIDPANDIDGVFDIAIDAGRIAALQQTLDPARAAQKVPTRLPVRPSVVAARARGQPPRRPKATSTARNLIN